jgi:hypothetical protein
MSIHPGKLVNIVIVCVIFGIGGTVFLFSQRNDDRYLRTDLTRFYEARLQSCAVLTTDSLKYAGNRGYTPIAYTSCSPDYFPIILEEGDADAIHKGLKINKEGNSVDLIVFDNSRQYKLKLRHPDYYNFSYEILTMIIVLVILVIGGILISPDKEFDRLLK